MARYPSRSFSMMGVTEEEPATVIFPLTFPPVKAPVLAWLMYPPSSTIFCPSSLRIKLMKSCA